MAGTVINEMAFAAVPYRRHGRAMDGADCWGFVRLAAASVGIDLPYWNEVDVCDLEECAGEIADLRDTYCTKVILGSEHTGDVVHMWSVVGGKKRRLHLGIVTRPGRLMHLERIGGVKAVPVFHATVASRILGIYRFHGSDQRHS